MVSPSVLKLEVVCCWTFSRMPSAPMMGVGNMAVPADSLYRLAFPLMTGMLNASAAWAMPAMASCS